MHPMLDLLEGAYQHEYPPILQIEKNWKRVNGWGKNFDLFESK